MDADPLAEILADVLTDEEVAPRGYFLDRSEDLEVDLVDVVIDGSYDLRAVAAAVLHRIREDGGL
jgi:hypothetical protein